MAETLVPEWDPVMGRPATDDEAEIIRTVKVEYARLRERIRILPANRERALAITHLEDSCMRAVRAVLEGAPPTPTSNAPRA